jgi:hypothetical protein
MSDFLAFPADSVTLDTLLPMGDTIQAAARPAAGARPPRLILATDDTVPLVLNLRNAPAVLPAAQPPAPTVPLWHRSLTRALVLIIAVALAYRSPLSQLPSVLDPLDAVDQVAWFRLAAVLPIPVVLLWRGIRRGSEIEDHQVDLIVAFVLIGSALLITLNQPDITLSEPDGGQAQALASFPLFVAGAVILLYGVGGVWRIRLPLALALFAASPLASGTLELAGSREAQLAVIVTPLCLGLLPLIRRAAREVEPIRALGQPAIGSAPLITTSCLLLLATASLAAALWPGGPA